MNINNINKDLNKMKVDKSTKEALISLIDQKITDDMEKILQKMDIFNAEMRSLETRFTAQMEADRRVTNEKFEADRKAFAERTTTLTVVISVVGATIALIGIAITILLFLKN